MECLPEVFSSIADLTIRPSEEELLQESLGEETFKQVRDCLLQHGIVVLEGVMPKEKCRVLHEKMKEDLQNILSLPTDKQNTNYSAGHVSIIFFNFPLPVPLCNLRRSNMYRPRFHLTFSVRW